MSLFVDTSAWYAAVDLGDRHNERARQILSAQEQLVTTDHVLIETWRLLRHRLGKETAERFWEGIRAGVARLEYANAVDLEAAWAIGQAFADQDFSLVDRTSFAAMERLGIDRAASFDDHFAVYRYGRNRSRAFVVVR